MKILSCFTILHPHTNEVMVYTVRMSIKNYYILSYNIRPSGTGLSCMFKVDEKKKQEKNQNSTVYVCVCVC